LDQAVYGAADKMVHLIEKTLGWEHDQESHRTDPPVTESKLTEKS
jgi:hypothetical protein